MSPRLLRQIIAILLGAVVGWGLLASWQRQKRAADATSGIVLPALAPASTDTIRYIGPGDTVILARNGTAWTANGFAAAQPVVDAFFHATTDNTSRSELISESATSHERLGVDSTHAKHLVVTGGGKALLDLHFGGRGPDFEGFYVRQGRDPKVFLLRGTFANLTVQGIDDWRDKTLLAVAKDSVGHVDVTRGKTRYQVTRGSSTWSLGNGSADSTRVSQFLGNFTSLRATGFPRPEQMDSAKFAPAERVVELFNLGGTSIGRLELDSISWGWMVRKDGALYKLDQRMVDLITPLPDSLLRR
ncbi:MAG TPA: DUF4340 domain-containing protein [Gemmatimonadales bacterium]|nr:DUF4340 domain-containing protein [Gemmatimonadales bacterium]